MHTRYLLIGAVATSLATLAAAEPAKPEVRESTPPAERPAEVVLASAEQVPPQVPMVQEQQAPAPAKKRAARVTTCRCAGQNQR